MTTSSESYLSPSDVLQLLLRYKRRWLVPMVSFTLLAVAYALVKVDTWEASQALIIREEATVDSPKAGRFNDLAQMQTVQETIVELSRSRSVLKSALIKVGPPANYQHPERFPTDKDIANLREVLKITPPNGSEFGKTEVFYLKIKDPEHARAIALVSAVCNELEDGFRTLRGARFKSMVEELAKTQTLAESDLKLATDRLADIEKQVGVDLGELRMLNTSATATSDLRQKLVEMQNELRGYEADKSRNEQLFALLQGAAGDPGRLLATPNSLLESQPALRRLKDGLLDAQLSTARMLGTMASAHPLVQAAKTAEVEIGEHLHDELAIAIKGIEVDLRLTDGRIANLKAQLNADRQRLERLASLRAEYDNLLATSANRTNLLETARRNLADARANEAATGVVSLISRIDRPDTGVYPVGPGKSMIAGAGLFGGLLIGMGIVFVTTGPSPTTPSPTDERRAPAEASERGLPPSQTRVASDDDLSFKKRTLAVSA